MQLWTRQRENYLIGETTFKELKEQMHDKFNKDVLKKLENCYKIATPPAHFLAFLLHQKADDEDINYKKY